jgi:transposase
MDSVMISVGLDYHPESIQVCILNDDGKMLANQSCANHWQHVVQLADRHGTVRRAGIEACCGAADLADELIAKAGWPVDLAHPGYVRRMKRSPDKHDHGDAHVLADLQRVGYLPKVWLAPACVRELRRLVRFRQQLADRKRDVKLRIGAVLRELRLNGPGTRWTKPWLAWLASVELSGSTRFVIDQHLAELSGLKDRIAATETRLGEVTADDPLIEKLLEQPGIGPVTAWVIRAEVGRFDRFQCGKQLSRFCGLTPCNASSGARQSDAGLVRAGNPMLKSALIEAAHRLSRHDDHWRDLYHKLTGSGKPACVALAAVANRWMRKLFHQMRAAEAPEAAQSSDAATPTGGKERQKEPQEATK